jgi:predicted ATPase
VLILAIARPELLDARPSWGAGIPRATAIEVAPLDAPESEELASALLAERDVPPAQRALVLERAEGNPLFLEEIARALSDASVPERIPDTVQALIAARIDRLAVDEKRVLQSAALVGRVFWRSALDRLAPDVDVAAVIDALLARDFVVPEERSTISRDRAFRFKHVLIRDVAYGGMSKTQRAEEHQAFAAWVGERAHDELAEIRAYHLDQAARLLARLEGAVPDDLAGAAAGALEEAGRRALRRGAFLVARTGRCCARWSSNRHPGAAISPRTPRGVSPTFPRSARRLRKRSPMRGPPACPTSKGERLSCWPSLRCTPRATSCGPTTSPTRRWRSFRSTSWPGSTTPTR